MKLSKVTLTREVEWRLQAAGITCWSEMYLIGSRAGGRIHSESDYDVAVVVPPRFRTPMYQSRLDQMLEEEYMEDGEEYKRSNQVDIFLVGPRGIQMPYIEWPHL